MLTNWFVNMLSPDQRNLFPTITSESKRTSKTPPQYNYHRKKKKKRKKPQQSELRRIFMYGWISAYPKILKFLHKKDLSDRVVCMNLYDLSTLIPVSKKQGTSLREHKGQN